MTMTSTSNTELTEIADALISRCRLTGIQVSAVVKDEPQPHIEASIAAAQLTAIIRPSTRPNERFYATDPQGNVLCSGPIVLEKFSANQIVLMVAGWLIHNTAKKNLAEKSPL